MAVLRMTHVGICVTDVERSIRFYRDLLGFAYRSELRVQGEPSDTLLRLRGVDLHAAGRAALKGNVKRQPLSTAKLAPVVPDPGKTAATVTDKATV